jgi:hypothetical protein
VPQQLEQEKEQTNVSSRAAKTARDLTVAEKATRITLSPSPDDRTAEMATAYLGGDRPPVRSLGALRQPRDDARYLYTGQDPL